MPYHRVVAAPQDLPLASEFARPTEEQWRALVDRVLDGASFERRLVGRTYDGRTVQPLYTAADAPAPDAAGLPGLRPFTRGRTAGRRVVDGWDIRQRHEGADPAAVNEAILEDLAGGATSVLLGPVGDGDRAALSRALQGVLVDVAPVCLDWGDAALDGAEHLAAHWADSGVPGSEVVGEAGLDPFGAAARRGRPVELGPAVDAALRLRATFARVRPLRVDVSRYALAGAAEAQELAFALAGGVTYLRALADAGVAVDDALPMLGFTLTATPDQFATLTKLRAARRCWDRVAEACGARASTDARGRGRAGDDGPARGMYLHAVTSLAHYSQRDPWVNPLRATLACFAAATGGADAITVLPLGTARAPSGAVTDEEERRLARNTQVVLAEESGLGRVIDPGGGSYAIEALTEDLAAEAWRRFQEIEGRGGLAAVLDSGWAAEEIERTWAAHLDDVVHRRAPLTGVTEYPLAGEAAPPRPSATGAPTEDGPFPLRRLAAPFEALRDAADAAPRRPRVFLANLGPLAVHTTRAGFARNLFEVGGFEVVAGGGVEHGADLADELRASGAELAVICSSDAVYAEHAAEAARALRGAGARRVYLAGNPGEQRAAYEAAGVDEFVALGGDALDVLRRALVAAGVPVAADDPAPTIDRLEGIAR